VKQGRIFGKTLYVPYDTVTDASSDGVNLSISRSDLAAASQQEPDGALLDGRSVVQHADSGVKGTLTLVAVHPESGALAYLVVRNLRRGQNVLIQQHYVAKLEKGMVMVSIPESVLQTLPPYRSDSELQQEVENVLFDLTPLHVDFEGMNVRVLDGVLYLDGNISSALRADIVQDQAAGVRGLLEIKNNLVGDDTLASGLASALAKDPRTRDLPIGVYPRLGVVRLSGAVHTEDQKAAATEIARKFPGVRSVVNDLVVDPKADLLRVMASAEGGEAEDRVPGGKYIRHTK
jgi:osmotically-inducible protein OsmY